LEVYATALGIAAYKWVEGLEELLHWIQHFTACVAPVSVFKDMAI